MKNTGIQRLLTGIVAALAATVLLAGCNLFGGHLSPPDWIIGEWESDSGNRAVFTDDNLILSGTDFEEQRILGEDSSSSRYTIEVEHVDGKATYKFEKESSNTLKFSSSRLSGSETMTRVE